MATPGSDGDRERLASARALTLATLHAAEALEALAHASATSVRSVDEAASGNAGASLRALAESARSMREYFAASDETAPAASPSASTLSLSFAGMTPSSALSALSRTSMAALPAIAAAAKTVAAAPSATPLGGGTATESAAALPAFSRLAVQAALAGSHFTALKSVAALHRVVDIGPTMAQLGGALDVLGAAAEATATSMARAEHLVQDAQIVSPSALATSASCVPAAPAVSCATATTVQRLAAIERGSGGRLPAGFLTDESLPIEQRVEALVGECEALHELHAQLQLKNRVAEQTASQRAQHAQLVTDQATRSMVRAMELQKELRLKLDAASTPAEREASATEEAVAQQQDVLAELHRSLAQLRVETEAAQLQCAASQAELARQRALADDAEAAARHAEDAAAERISAARAHAFAVDQEAETEIARLDAETDALRAELRAAEQRVSEARLAVAEQMAARDMAAAKLDEAPSSSGQLVDSTPVLASAPPPAPAKAKKVISRASSMNLEAMRAAYAKLQNKVVRSKPIGVEAAADKAATPESANRDLRAESDSDRATLVDTQATTDVVAARASAIDSLMLDLEAARAELAVSQSEADSLRSALDALNEALQSAQRQLEEERDGFDLNLIEHIVTRKDLERQLAVALEAGSDISSENVAELVRSNDAFQREFDSLRAALVESHSNATDLLVRLADTEARRRDLEIQLAAALEAGSEIASESAAEFSQSSDMLTRELESLRSALAESQSNAKESRVKLTEADARIVELEEELAFLSDELVFGKPALVPKQMALVSAGVATAAPASAQPPVHNAAVFAVGFLMGAQKQEFVRVTAAAQAAINQASTHIKFLRQEGDRVAQLAADAAERAEEAAMDAEFARLEQIAAARKEKAAEAVDRARQQVLDETERREAERAAAEKRKLERQATLLKKAQDEAAAQQRLLDLAAAKKAADDLNPWKVVVNPTTAQVFYFNMQSGETAWDEPAGGAAPPSDASTAAAMAALEAHALSVGSNAAAVAATRSASVFTNEAIVTARTLMNSRELEIIVKSAELEADRARLPVLRSWLTVKQGKGANAEFHTRHFALVDFNLYSCRKEISVTDGEIGADAEIEGIPLLSIEAIATKKNAADGVGRFDIKCTSDNVCGRARSNL